MDKIYLSHPPQIEDVNRPKAIAMGYFDGVHKGHQKVIKTAVDYARQHNLEACVMTFHPHPSVVLKQLKKRDDYLTPPDKKAEIIAGLGVDKLYFVTFNQEFSQLSPEQFVDQYLINLNVHHVVAGFDFTYGRMAKGNMEAMREYSKDRFSVSVVQKITYENEKISTTKIRELILEGRVDQVQSLLGRYYTISGTLAHEESQTMGIPLAIFRCDAPYVLPALGAYLVRIKAGGESLPGVCYVSQSTDSESTNVRVYLIQETENLNQRTVEIEWYTSIQDKEEFHSIDDIISRILKDKERALDFF